MQKLQDTTGYDCYTGCERVPLDRGRPLLGAPRGE